MIKNSHKLRADNGGHSSCKASVTVETAFAFPLFFFFIWTVWQIFLVLMLQLNVTIGVAKTASALAQVGYVQRESSGEKCENVEILWVPAIYVNVLTGKEGFYDFLRVSFKEEGDSTYIIEVKGDIPVAAPVYGHFFVPFDEKYKIRAHTGTWDRNRFLPEEKSTSEKDNETKEEKVYVTENGSVYHTSLACSHLSVRAEAVGIGEVADRRNRDGKRYEECSYCKDATHGETVYITAYGTKFHYSADCQVLRRSVKEVELKDVGDLKPCSTCSNTK